MTTQEKLIEAIKTDAERVIALAIAFKPSVAIVVSDSRRDVPDGSISSLAALACRYALRGETNEETAANLENFVATL